MKDSILPLDDGDADISLRSSVSIPETYDDLTIVVHEPRTAATVGIAVSTALYWSS
jgi:hypothetical protein